MAEISRGQVYAVVSTPAQITRGQVYVVVRPKAKRKPVINFGFFAGEPIQTAFRYWRVLVSHTVGGPLNPAVDGGFVGLRYLGMEDALTGVDAIDPLDYLTKGSSSDSQVEQGYNVFRGPVEDSNGVTDRDVDGLRWFQYDFGDTVTIDVVAAYMKGRKSGYSEQFPMRFIMQASNDATAWSDRFTWDRTGDPLFVWTMDNIYRFDGAPKLADTGKDVPHKFWRLRAKTFIDGSWVTFRNIKYYSDTGYTNQVSVSGATFGTTAILEGSVAGAYGDPGNRMTAQHSSRPFVMTVEFPTAQSIKGISLSSRAAYGGQAIDTFSVDYSDDGMSWYEAWAVASQSPWGEDIERFFADPGSSSGDDGDDFETTVTVSSGKVASNLTNFPMKVDLADAPPGFWAGVKENGDNIRFTTSADVDVPVDVVSINRVNETGTIFVKVDLLSASDNIFKLKTVKFAEFPAPGDAIGRFTVWSDYESVMLMNGLTDRTSSERALSLIGSPSVSGGWLNTSSSNYAKINGVSKLTTWTMGISGILTSFGSNRTLASYGASDVGGNTAREGITYRSSSNRFGTWNSVDTWNEITAVTPVVSTKYRLNLTHNALVDRKLYLDGTLGVTNTGVAQRPQGLGDTVAIGAENAGSEGTIGQLRYFYLRSGELSADWIAAENVSWEGSGFYTI